MERIEIEDLLTYRFLSGLEAAPEGENAIFTLRGTNEKKDGYSSDIYLLENGKTRRLTGDGKSSGGIWEDKDHILFPAMRDPEDQERAKNGEPLTVWYRMSIHGGEAEKAFTLPVVCSTMKRIGKLWFFLAQIDRAYPDEYRMTPEEKEALAKERKENQDYHILTDFNYRMNGQGYHEGKITALFTFDPETGKVCRITEPSENVRGAEAFGDEILYFSARYQKVAGFYHQVYAYAPASGTTRTLYGGNDYGIMACFHVGGKPVLLASDYREYDRHQNPGFYTVENGAMKLICDPDLGMGNSVGSDCRLGGGSFARVVGEELYFTCTVESRCELRKLTADGRVVTLNNAEGSLDCFSVTEKGTVLGVGMYHHDLQEIYTIGRGKKVTCLTAFNRECLQGKYRAVPRKLSVRSGGKRIDGWVLLPKDYDDARTYPAVLDIHGGPKTAYGELFFHEMQVWASRGYFVFFCNPTGSEGRGNAFMDLRGKYGTVDYRNIMDFTDAVLDAYPQIDRKRVAVTGGSYGGFMTNWILGHTDRFVCAASQRSISNWFSFYGASDIGIGFSNEQNNATIFDGQKEIWNHSPLKYAANFVTPTLFIHSEEDYRCPIDQGLQMYAALLEKGVDTRFIWFKGENHELSRSGKPMHRMKRLTEITDWFEKYTKD